MLLVPEDHRPIESERIRKQWHNGEWYFSVIDVIAVLLETDYKKAQSYWSTLKQRLSRDSEYDPVLRSIVALKLPCITSKLYFTDTITAAAGEPLWVLISRYKTKRKLRLSYEEDEVENFHPIVIKHLQKNGWNILHHVRLPSGHVIDVMAIKADQRLIVECKLRLTDQKFH